MEKPRKLEWAAGTRESLRGFPEDVRSELGQGLYLAEQSKFPLNGSHMRGRLAGVVELASDETGDTYRLYYTLKCSGHVYILYCHKKKSKQGSEIPKHEEDLIVKRYKDALRECESRRKAP